YYNNNILSSFDDRPSRIVALKPRVCPASIHRLIVDATAFCARLARDKGGNTLAIIAASLVPLMAMIGSGVDMSRAYMARTRLQSACDSAAIAGRRAMIGDSFSASVTAEANRYFAFNFPQGTYQTAAFAPTISHPTAGTIRVTASTTIPTAIMGI